MDEYRKALLKLTMKLDAQIEAQVYNAKRLEGLALIRERARVRRQVLACDRCPLRPVVTTPTPYEGPRHPLFVAVGEAPGSQEELHGRPFVGPSGKLLKTLLSEVGFDIEDEVMFMNTVCCHPKKGASTTRVPTEQEQRYCRKNMTDQLSLGSSPYVLLAGATALSVFRNDLKVSEIHGRIFVWDYKYIVMPVLHPAAVLRQRNLIGQLKDDLTKWAAVVRENSFLKYLSETCIKCGSLMSEMDPDGVTYCDIHWQRYGMKEWERQKKRWQGETNIPLQFPIDVPVKVRAKREKKMRA